MTSQQVVFYEFVICNVFKKRLQRIYITTILCLIQVCFFSYYVFTAKAWSISLFDVNISAYYLPPVVITLPLLYENVCLMKNYGIKSFQQIGVVGNTLVGKNFCIKKSA